MKINNRFCLSRLLQRLVAAIDRRLLTEEGSSGRSQLACRLDRALLLFFVWLAAVLLLVSWLHNWLAACLAAVLICVLLFALYGYCRRQWLLQTERHRNIVSDSDEVLQKAAQQPDVTSAEAASTAVAAGEQQSANNSWTTRVLQRSQAKAFFKAAAVLLLFSWLFNDIQTVRVFYVVTAVLNLGLAVACLAQKKMAASKTAAADKP